MKKNKTVAYMLAATLLVGGTFVGTKALFTDNINSIGELAISTGDLDIVEVKDKDDTTGGWILTRNGMEYKDNTTVGGDTGDNINIPSESGGEDSNTTGISAFANNLKPGDKLTKIVTVKNIGTLKATNLSLIETGKADLGSLNGLIKLTHESIVEDGNDGILNPGDQATMKLVIEIPKDKGGAHDTASIKPEGEKSYNTNVIENEIINLTNAWQLEATQQNQQ